MNAETRSEIAIFIVLIAILVVIGAVAFAAVMLSQSYLGLAPLVLIWPALNAWASWSNTLV